MSNPKLQEQSSGDASTNVQAGTIVINQGPTCQDVRNIAMDIFRANSLQLSERAATVASARAQEILEKFLSKLQAREPDAIKSLETPGMQYALFSAQKDCARTGDKDLESLLVDILVDRATSEERSLQQIVLDEALTVAPKLNADQMDILTANFILLETVNNGIRSRAELWGYLDSHLVPFLGGIQATDSCYRHLEYAGCCSIAVFRGDRRIEQICLLNHPGLFMKGFSEDDWNRQFAAGEDSSLARTLLMPCLSDVTTLQINATDVNVLSDECQRVGVSPDHATKLENLFNRQKMQPYDVKPLILEARPNLEVLFTAWHSQLSKLTATTVGTAIAQANFRRRTGEKLDLATWVN